VIPGFLVMPAKKRVIQSARKPSAAPYLGTAQSDGIFPATQENTGKNPIGAQNRRGSSQIDPCNQVLISAFPMRLAGKEFSLPRMPAGKWRESQKEETAAGLVPRGEAGDFASREKFAFRPGVDPVNGEKRPLDHTLTHLFGPFPAVPSREFLFPATRTTRQLAGNVAGPPARPAAGHSDCPCPSRGGASPPWHRSYASIWTPRWRDLHGREDVGARASSHDWIAASKVGIEAVMLRMLCWTPACAGVTTIP
jgi:hypothetical protein